MEKFIRGISPEYNFLKFSIFPFFHFLDIRERSVTHHMAAPTNLWLVTTPKNGKMEKWLRVIFYHSKVVKKVEF